MTAKAKSAKSKRNDHNKAKANTKLDPEAKYLSGFTSSTPKNNKSQNDNL